MDPLDTRTIAMSPGAPRASGDAAHYLVVVEGEHPGLRKEIVASLTLGRDTSCRLRFGDAGVSKIHCRLRLEGESVMVSDLGSTNGTFVDGRRVEGTVVLGVESLLQVGAQVLRHELRSRAEVVRAEELASDLEKARAYMLALIPAPLVTGPVRTDWVFVPSAVLGGDLLGTHALDEDLRAFYLIDVCGHGAGAAMHTASVFNALRNRTLPDTDFRRPGEVLTRLNACFPMESHGGMYLTLWYGVHDARDGALVFASAGHPPALLRPRDGGHTRRLATRNPPIGVLEERRFDEARTTAAPGDRLYLFSDGVYEIETHDGRAWDFKDFEALVSAPRIPEVAESQRLLSAVRGEARGGVLDDDFSLLVVGFH